MFTEREFEKNSFLIRTLRHHIKSELLSNTNEQNALFDAFQKEGFKMNVNNKEEDVARNILVFIRLDIVTCYTMLEYPEKYNKYDFSFYDIASFPSNPALYDIVLYSDYVDYYSDFSYEEIRTSAKRMFELLRERTNFTPGRLSFYSILKEIKSSQCDEYIRTMQRIVQKMAEDRTGLSREGRLWLKRMYYKPDVLTDTFHSEYVMKADEKYVDTIPEDYFNLIDKTSDEMISFLREELYQSSSLNYYLSNHSEFSNRINSDEDFRLYMDIFFNKDICKIYNKLNHSINADTLEGKLLLAIIIKDSNVKLDNEKFNMYSDFMNSDLEFFRARESSISLLKSYYNVNVQPDTDDFLVKYYLDKVDPELSKKYMVLLYRVSSVVAKADGRITEEEAAWLSQLVSTTGIDEREEKPEEEATDNPIGELNSLIGLESVKKDVTSLSNFIKMKQMREAKGLKAPSISYHCVFTGNPGTGKTTVARILASIFKELGILKRGHLVETDRSGLVAEYVGQTAVKTNKIIDSALDGVLFIDEAYTLVGGQNDYGMEAIATLLKRMEDDRDRLIVILAGYPNEMEDFINSNPGLRSRFNRYIFFPDYSSTELYEIFHLNVTKNEYVITADADDYLKKKLDYVVQNKRKDFGNARYVRNYFESAIEHQANRLASDVNLTPEKLSELTIEDIDI